MSDTPLIIGHRGASDTAPENTLAAFRTAMDAGADGVEFDVRLARDGVPVVIHDATLARTGSRVEKVAAMTSEELAKIDVGSWFNQKHPKRANIDFAAQKVSTLEQTLTILSGFKGLIYIELKADDADYRGLATAVCDVIRPSPLLPQVIVKSFRLATIPVVRCQLPSVTTAALFAPKIMNFLRRRKHIIAIAHEFGAQQISLHRSLATKRLVERAAAANLPVTIWTANNPAWVERACARGIGALITNDPAKLLAVRAKLAANT
ncbi:MAG: glycerophosphodiester phosphodiesterase family protein [Pyrinomonadaceae bacterium]